MCVFMLLTYGEHAQARFCLLRSGDTFFLETVEIQDDGIRFFIHRLLRYVLVSNETDDKFIRTQVTTPNNYIG
jgi:hypothetical protein